MCFFSSPTIPTPAPIPRIPQPDSQVIMDRADQTRARALAQGGSPANIVSDLAPSDIASARPVLKPANAVYLGQ